MYYIGTKEECEAYNNLVTTGEGYHGTTTSWGRVLEHPTNDIFAIIKNDKYEAPLEQATTEEISNWYQNV